MLPKLTDTTQTISFSEGDGVCSSEVFASDVVVTTNAGTHNHGSSKVKLKNLVDYNWEPKNYPGQLLAIHMSGKYLAYAIKAPNTVNPGSWNGFVRAVYNPDPSTDKRALIKGMKGEVQDLAFAHIESKVTLACIDEMGNLYVYNIEVTDSGLRTTLIAEVLEDTGTPCIAPRVLWCPYIPLDDDAEDGVSPDEDVAKMLLSTHSHCARMWNMRLVVEELQASGDVRATYSSLLGGAGVLTASEHAAQIVDAAFSPDGTALATAAADGYVMFFQVYAHSDKEGSPRCLHKWQPHGGKPLSCLFFLDNYKDYNSDVQFWKFAVTGAENNSVLKIWSCKSWSCLQTVTFTPQPGADGAFGLKAALDSSASYLLLSDFHARSLYVLSMARDTEETTAYCKSISEFLLPYPVLSFCIIDAGEQQVKCESSCGDPFHRDGSSGDTGDSPEDFALKYDEEGVGEGGVVGGSKRVRVRLYIVQPKGLQEGELTFSPPADSAHALSELNMPEEVEEPAPAIASSILQQQSQQLKNLLMRTQTSSEAPTDTSHHVLSDELLEEPTNSTTSWQPVTIHRNSREVNNAKVIERESNQPPSTIKTKGNIDELLEKMYEKPESPIIETWEDLYECLDSAHKTPTPVFEECYSDQELEMEMEQLSIRKAADSAPVVLIKYETQPGSLIGQRPESPSSIPPPLNLMTPDAFSSPGKRDEEDPPLSATPEVSAKSRSSNAGFGGEEASMLDGNFRSGGSSPSREVRQIMSRDDEHDYFKEHLTDDNSQSPAAEKVPAATQNGAEQIYTKEDLFVPEQPPPVAGVTHTNNDSSWPQISIAHINEANQRKASSDKSLSESINKSTNDVAVARTEHLESKLEALENKLDKLTDLLTAQNRELRTLRAEMASPRENIEQVLHSHTQRTSVAIEKALSEGWERIAVAGEAAGNRAAQAAGVGAARALEPLAQALHHELAAKMSATDRLLSDNIDKLVNSKSVMEHLSTAIAASLSDMVRASFRDAMLQSAIPAMERAHAQIFRQINHAFLSGTREFTATTETMARAAAERGGAAAVTSLRAALDKHAEVLQGANLQPPPPQHISALIKEATHTVLEKEMAWWREQARSVVVEMSRAHTPATPAMAHASPMDRQMQVAQIQALLNAKDLNGAFQLALSASDLSLVMAACRAADPITVFTPPCRLKQHVLLSLVQQLGADMAHETNLKHRYLEEAVMNLDTSNPVTREHLPVVIRELQKQIMSFISGNPEHALVRQFKMLLMATESLVKSGV